MYLFLTSYFLYLGFQYFVLNAFNPCSSRYQIRNKASLLELGNETMKLCQEGTSWKCGPCGQ
jgi:hypothetical protein